MECNPPGDRRNIGGIYMSCNNGIFCGNNGNGIWTILVIVFLLSWLGGGCGIGCGNGCGCGGCGGCGDCGC